MKSPEDGKLLPMLFASLQRTLEPNFTYSTLERVRYLCFQILRGFSRAYVASELSVFY